MRRLNVEHGIMRNIMRLVVVGSVIAISINILMMYTKVFGGI